VTSGATFEWANRGESLTITSMPAEEFLNDKGGIDQDKLRELFVDEKTYLAAVVNPFASDTGLAEQALKEAIAILQDKRDYRLADAIPIAARVLFHVPTRVPQDAPPAKIPPPIVGVDGDRVRSRVVERSWRGAAPL